jgi:hypothetical protein
LFNSFEALEIEVSDFLVPNLNVITPCNSIKGSRKTPSGVVIGNCPVKKKNIILSPIAEPAVVISPVIPVMDANKSIYTHLRSMKRGEYEQFAPVCSSNCSSYKPVEMLGQEPEFIIVPVLFSYKTIHEDVLQHFEAMGPLTHVVTGTMRESPLYKATCTEGDSHFLAYPARLTVKKALTAFLEQNNNFEEGTFVVDRHPSNVHIFKDWSEVTCIQPEWTITPLQIYIMELPKGDYEQVIKYTTERHYFQFKGTVNTVPCSILLDTGASGTDYIDRQHCVKEGIVLDPAHAHQIIVMADESKTKCTNMATIKLRLGRYKCQVECLVIDHLEDYPLVMGNPWLNWHIADISYQRQQVILRKPGPDGQHYIINTFIDKTQKPLEPELCVVG